VSTTTLCGPVLGARRCRRRRRKIGRFQVKFPLAFPAESLSQRPRGRKRAGGLPLAESVATAMPPVTALMQGKLLDRAH
jgi:hypothetical protein